MAVLKKIKFGAQGTATPLAKTVLTAKSGGVMSVAAPTGVTNGVDEDKDYQYELDVNVDGTTLVKSTTGEGEQAVTQLAVGTVPAAKVSVAAGGHTTDGDNKIFVGDDVEEVLTELDNKISRTDGAAKTYKIVEAASPASTSLKEYKVQVAVGDGAFTDDTNSATIIVPKDQHLKSVVLVNQRPAEQGESGPVSGNFLKFTYVLNDGTESDVYVDVSAFLAESEFGDGLEVSNAGVVSAKLGQGLEFGGETGENQSIKVKIDSTSESFLTVGAGGVKLAGVQNAIDAKVAALDFTTDAAVAGQYVAAIEETDGVVSVKTRANVSDAVLTGYAKGSAPAAGSEAVAATDDVKGAIAKLEHQVDAAKSAASAAHSVVAKDTNANHLTVTPTTDQSTGAVTYTIGENDIASDSDLDAEVTRAQSAETAIDSAVGLTKAASGETRSFSPTTNYGGTGASAATSVMANMQKIDTALKNLSDTVGAIQYSVSGTELTFYGMTQHT